MDIDYKVALDESMGLPSKARKKRLRKKAKGAASAREEKHEDEQVCNTLVRVCSDGDATILHGEVNNDDDIEVVETAGYKKYMRGMAQGHQQCGEKARANRQNFYNKNHNIYFDSSNPEECYDSDCFHFNSSDEYIHQQAHRQPRYNYEKMKSKQNSASAKKFTKGKSMSENVDGYVGQKSMDFIMDFLGEEKDTDSIKKTKKQSKSKAPKKQQKEGNCAAETKKKEQTTPKRASSTAKDTKSDRVPPMPTRRRHSNTKISSNADEQVPHLKKAAVLSTKESGVKPKKRRQQ